MNIIPFEKYELRSSLQSTELIKNIDRNCDPNIWFPGFRNVDKLFYGGVGKNTFKICRVTRNNNSFIPVAVCNLTSDGSEVVLEVKLRLNRFVQIFSLVWLLFCILMGAGIAIDASIVDGLSAMTPFLAFFYFLMQYLFWSEVPKIKSLISDFASGNT